MVVVCVMVVSQAWAKSKNVDVSENQIDQEAEVEGGYKNTRQDPCYDMDCGVGHECDIDDDNNPVCICAKKCTEEVEERAKVNVCSDTNVTFASLCELKRQRCTCSKPGRKGCDNPDYANVDLDYFGTCKDLGQCEEFEEKEYPGRMREWLFLIMEELDSRKELNKKASKMAKKAVKAEKKWVIPVLWKLCELDVNNDGAIDRHEQLPISAPLKPMEHCTMEFLQGCDDNEDKEISMWEWGHCLGLEDDEVDVVCDMFKDEE